MNTRSHPPATEVNFDGVVGPTHNFSALSWGNRASMGSDGLVSRPREAALEGLAKARRLSELGAPQAVFPPLRRPFLRPLREVGFEGDLGEILARAADEAPELLAACYSASSMWAANSATVTPSVDAPDGRVHLTPANLVSNFHRSLEREATAEMLRQVFPSDERFRHHHPLPRHAVFADEGAANHLRFASAYGEPGVHLFVYGRDEEAPSGGPTRFPARHSREACLAVARRHGLSADAVVFAKQSPAAIDAGVFHTDVISTGNLDVFLYHAESFVDTAAVVDELAAKFRARTGRPLRLAPLASADVSLDEAVTTYLFNSQLVIDVDGRVVLVAPVECRRSPRVAACLDRLADAAGPLDAVEFVDVNQSMRNGGGPACLRLRVVLTEAELAAVLPGVRLSEPAIAGLTDAIVASYPEAIAAADLSSPDLCRACWEAADRVARQIGFAAAPGADRC